MRYHLKEDGTAGVCKAEVGKCPKGSAIHGNSIGEVYSELENVMKEQLFTNISSAEIPPRLSARELGGRGMLMHVKKPEVVKEQLEALSKLGLIAEALLTLKEHKPAIGEAWETGQQNALDYQTLYEEPLAYSNWVADHPNGAGHTAEYTTGEEYTWVANVHYELQTIALNSLMDRLETGSLEGVDLEAYRVALGDTSVAKNAQLAFNYNPNRQPEDFYDNVKTRLLREGFAKDDKGLNRSDYKIPGFIWKGLDQETRERFAAALITADFNGYQKNSAEQRMLGSRFGDIVSAVFTHEDSKHYLKSIAEGTPVTFSFGPRGRIEGNYKFTDEGIEWTENSRIFEETKTNLW